MLTDTDSTASTTPPLVGRTRELDEIMGLARSSLRRPAQDRSTQNRSAQVPPVLLITGPAGSGRTALLDEAARLCVEDGIGLLRLRLRPEDATTPYGLVYRLASDLDRTKPAAARSGSVGRSKHDLLDTIMAAVGTEHDVAGSMLLRIVAALAAAMASVGPLAVLLDDAQWIDPASVGVLTMFCARVTSPARLVLTLPTGTESIYHELTGSGTGHILPLRPLDRVQVAEVVAGRCNGAIPEAELVDAVYQAARGNARATVSVIDTLMAGDSVHVVHGHAVLSDAEPAPIIPVLPAPLLTTLRERGSRRWAIATGMAVLAPLGAGAVAVLAEELGLPVADIVDVLDVLTAERILARGADPRCWTFRLPVVASALAACVGPARSRTLAGLATAMAGRGTTADPFLVDLVANAGSLVDPEHAVTCLLDAAGNATAANAARWYRAAVDLTTDVTRRGAIEMQMVRAGIEGGHWTETVVQIEEALSTDNGRHGEADVAELMVSATTAAVALGDDDELRRIAQGMPNEPAAALARVAALIHLGRWSEADDQLAANRPTDGVPGELARRLTDIVHLALGRPPVAADPSVASVPPRVLAEAVRHDHTMACLRGDLPPARTAAVAPHPEIAVLAHHLAGNWDGALRAARVMHARSTGTARSPLPMTAYWRAAEICALRAEFGRARDWIELGRSTGAPAGHLLAVAQAYLLTSTGDDDGAKELLGQALDTVADTGIHYGLEEILGTLVDTEVAAGRVEDARAYCARLARLAGSLGTGRAQLLALLARAATEQDLTAATAAVDLARRRAQPAELATTLLAAAKVGLRPAALLRECYELFDGLNALAGRAEVRALMRDTSGSLPRREGTAEEQTRLLMRLVADGLSNRQVAAVLRTTPKAVEGQLGRLFARTGLRSRVELTTALLAGDVTELMTRVG